MGELERSSLLLLLTGNTGCRNPSSLSRCTNLATVSPSYLSRLRQFPSGIGPPQHSTYEASSLVLPVLTVGLDRRATRDNGERGPGSPTVSASLGHLEQTDNDSTHGHRHLVAPTKYTHNNDRAASSCSTCTAPAWWSFFSTEHSSNRSMDTYNLPFFLIEIALAVDMLSILTCCPIRSSSLLKTSSRLP